MLELITGAALGAAIGILATLLKQSIEEPEPVWMEKIWNLDERVGELELENKELSNKLANYGIRTTEHANAIKELDRYIHEVL